MIPATMTAIMIDGGTGPADALKPTVLPTPSPGPGQILIRTRAAGVNRPDLFQRTGLYPPPAGASSILGLEVAGEVVAIGPDTQRWQVGDRVTALLSGGGYAEYAVAEARHALPIPKGFDFEHAAGLPETAFTVYANLFEHGALQSGETIMIHGATSGIGVMAIQMAKAAGARVIATGRGAAKAAEALRLGSDVAVDTTQQDFAAIAAADGGVDVILDMVAGPYFSRNLESLRTGGRLVHIAYQAGATVELPLVVVMLKQLVITGSTLRARDAAEKARLAAAVEQSVWPWIESGKVQSILDRVYPLADAAHAHMRLEGSSHVGKVVLKA